MKCFIFFLLIPFSFCGAQNSAGAPLVFKETSFDFGSVAEDAAPISHRFYYYNRTVWPVIILSVNSDCGANLLDWTKTPVKPDKGGMVVVSYDPKGKSGYFNKQISVQTDWFNFSIRLQLSGNVIRSNKAPAKYPYKYGHFHAQKRSVFFKEVYINKDAKPIDFALFNDSHAPIAITKIVTPPYLQVQMPLSIGAHQSANMTVTYDGAKRKLGYHSDVIELQTNDIGYEVKRIPIYAMIEEYFPPLSDAEFFSAPVAALDTPLIDFGIAKTSSVIGKVVLKNTGARELRIRDIVPNHFSISVISPYKNVLKKNDTTWLKFMFTPYGQVGKLYKAATLFTSDPRHSTQNILMTMECQ